MFRVMCVIPAGAVGTEFEVSQHKSKAAAFRKMHSLNRNRTVKDYYYQVEDEDYNVVIEVKTKRNGRWVIV